MRLDKRKPPRHEIDRVGLHERGGGSVLGGLHLWVQKILHADVAVPDQVGQPYTHSDILGIDVVAELVRLVGAQNAEGGVRTIFSDLLDDDVALPLRLAHGDGPWAICGSDVLRDGRPEVTFADVSGRQENPIWVYSAHVILSFQLRLI